MIATGSPGWAAFFARPCRPRADGAGVATDIAVSRYCALKLIVVDWPVL